MKFTASAVAAFALMCGALTATAKVIDFEKDAGAVADKDDLDTCWKNGGLINTTLASLQPGDTFVFPNKTYHIMGGIKASGLKDVVLQFDGSEFSSRGRKETCGQLAKCINPLHSSPHPHPARTSVPPQLLSFPTT